MASKDDHFRKGRNNRTFAESLALRDQTEVGWALTALFYSALHFIEAYSARYGKNFYSHQERNEEVQTNPVHTAIADEYMDLNSFGWNARYTMQVYERSHYEEAHRYLEAIEAHVAKLLSL